MSTPSPSADRNLIFGLLALQMEFVSRAQLLEAMHAWMLDKKTPLGELLCRRGALKEEDRADIDRLVSKHIQRHGGDTQASLGALHFTPDMEQELKRLDDRDVQASLASLTPAAGHGVAAKPAVRAGDAAPVAVRFCRLREHAKGGLGEVFVALDTELHREVALKEIQDCHADHPDSRARFLLEAEVTGNLEHPGIVPVYGLGAYADGRPYYAMRFIRGQTMHDAIADFHKADRDPRRTPGERSLALRELLSRFVAVCQAVAYAHSRGVIHRDLKPANVMLGDFGETLVVDWGLARLRNQTDVGQTILDRPVLPATGLGIEATEKGRVVGTAAYMPPEQAEGRLERVGVASDVFALGATLYCLLTGRAPYDGGDALAQARRAAVVPARQRKRSVPAALEAVCGKAMAAKPEDRYATAWELAEEVQRFLADEPVRAHREPLSERLRRWVKRHRPMVAALAAGLVTMTVALAVGLAAVNTEKNRTTAALERSRESEKSAAEQRQLALQTVRRVVDDIHTRLKDRPGQKELRKELLAQALEGLKQVARAADTRSQVDHETIVVHFELGNIFLEIEEGGTVEAKKQYEIAHDLARRFVEIEPGSADAQRDLAVSFIKLGDAHVRGGDSKAALTAYQQSLEATERLARADPTSTQAQRDLSVSIDRLAAVQLEVGDTRSALASYSKSLERFKALAEADPENAKAQNDLALSYNTLGDVQMRMGDNKSALASYKRGLEVSERQARADPGSALALRYWFMSCIKLGDVYLQLGDGKSALASFQQSLELSKRQVEADPTNALAQSDLLASYLKLGDVHLRSRDAKSALSFYKQVLEMSERQAKTDPGSAVAARTLSAGHEKLGDVQTVLGDRKSALASYQKSLEIRKRLALANPSSAQAQRDLAVICNRLGEVQMQSGDSKSALAYYQQCLEIAERQARADPGSALAQRDLFVSCNKLGEVQMQLGDNKSALAFFQRSLEMSKRLARANPASAEARRDLAVSYEKQGDVQMRLGDSKSALASYQQSLEVIKQGPSAYLNRAETQRELLVIYLKLANAQMQLGDNKSALSSFGQRLEVSQRLARTEPNSGPAQRDLLVNCYYLGNLELQAGEFNKAADWYKRALDIPKRFPKPELFKQEVGIIDGRLRFCSACVGALAEPASALKQPEDLRLNVLAAVTAALVKQRNTDKALAAADLLAANTKAPEHLYDAACAYALCVPLADRPETREKRAARAVALLRQAVSRGYKDAAHMKTDADLDALRERDDFKKLVAEVEAASRPAGKER